MWRMPRLPKREKRVYRRRLLVKSQEVFREKVFPRIMA